jgi:hypothetical protein
VLRLDGDIAADGYAANGSFLFLRDFLPRQQVERALDPRDHTRSRRGCSAASCLTLSAWMTLISVPQSTGASRWSSGINIEEGLASLIAKHRGNKAIARRGLGMTVIRGE